MSKIICPAQSEEEIDFILKNFAKKVIFLPLNLSAQLHCIHNNIDFYDPIKLVTDDFHQQTIKYSKELIDNLNYEDIKEDSHRKEFKAFIRFRFHTVAFILELIEQLKAQKKIDEIILSGWDCYYNQFSKKNYFISSIILDLIDDIKITTVKKLTYIDYSDKSLNKYYFDNTSLDKNQTYILLTNLGYNFFRIFLFLWKKNKKIICPLFQEINFIKKTIYKILGVKFLKLVKIKSSDVNNIKLPHLKYNYKGKDLSKILNRRVKQERINVQNLVNKSVAIDDLFKSHKIKFVFTNVSKGVSGYFVDAARKFNIPSVCIPHGTLSKNFDNYDIIYKKTISEAVTSKNAQYNISQSNISKGFFEHNKNDFNNIINSGNLIFSNKEENRKKYKKLLFAVTIKDLESIQLLGVEMYYEFINNLFFLESFSKKNDYNFIVKLHPIAHGEMKILQKIFKNLEFSNKKISKSFDNIFATLSFSSTVIEDSLYSKCPLILLDRWKRYKHCDAEENPETKDSAIYYINDEENLIKCINSIKLSENIDYSKYILSSDYKRNINDLLSRLF